MRHKAYEAVGILLLIAAVVFFYFSTGFLADGDHFGGLLVVFIGLALVRAGLEMTKLSILERKDTN